MKSMLMGFPAGQPPDLAGSCWESNPELLQCCCPAGQVAHHACTALQTKCAGSSSNHPLDQAGSRCGSTQSLQMT